jgi:hypothetical protein
VKTQLREIVSGIFVEEEIYDPLPEDWDIPYLGAGYDRMINDWYERVGEQFALLLDQRLRGE